MTRTQRPCTIALAPALVLLVTACGGARGAPDATPAPSPVATPDVVDAPAAPSTRVLLIPQTSPRPAMVSDEAAAAWRASTPAPAIEGTCTARRMPEPGVQSYTLSSRNDDGSTNSSTVFVDGTGKVLRYSEARGLPRVTIEATDLSPAQRDSAVRAQLGAGPRTVITLDYVTGEATAIDTDAPRDQPAGIRGSAASFDTLPNMGPPRARSAAVLARCAER